MKLVCPDYYPAFRCVAEKCRHSCCLGWEIDIDSEALARYDRLRAPMKERLAAAIDRTGDEAHFRLTEDERCPFLNDRGLCELILELGEDSLCQICRDHPRFRSFYSGMTEVGVGLCCEAAAQLVLSWPEPVQFITLSDDGTPLTLTNDELSLLHFRETLISVMQDRSLPVEHRVDKVLSLCGVKLPDKTPAQWAGFYQSLERLEPSWTQRLVLLQSADLQNAAPPHGAFWDIAFEQLMVYFLYRHLPGALDDGDPADRVAFAALNWHMVRALCAAELAGAGCITPEDMTEIVRQYSAEIEYSAENTEALLDCLYDARQ